MSTVVVFEEAMQMFRSGWVVGGPVRAAVAARARGGASLTTRRRGDTELTTIPILLRIVLMKTSTVLLGALPLVSLLAACGSDAQSGDTRVVASFYPYAYVAEQVGGTHVEVDNLTSPGVEPHDVELKPKQVGAVQTADLVIYQRGFQTAVDDAVDQADRSGDDVLDIATVVKLEESHAEESHEDEHAHEGESTTDPHVWLDPTTMVTITHDVEKRLADADPDHASDFAANARRLERELTRLDTAFSDGLKNVPHPDDRHEPRGVPLPRRAHTS